MTEVKERINRRIAWIISDICKALIRKMQQKCQVDGHRLSVASVMKYVFNCL